ncbi:serine/arginine repetitive matrix protein 1-like isoform X2 [Ornithodoros turicata]|uniref:serine/arginine repetitive matrix protein 1-like isoform X2 n=1 Tax=Ornithodoros turicata TaxID=34597 RepID=UPI0031391631
MSPRRTTIAVGRRTSIDLRVRRRLSNALEEFKEYFDESSLDNKASSKEGPPPPKPVRIGRRTGKNVMPGKVIRRHSNGRENFLDYFTDDSSGGSRGRNATEHRSPVSEAESLGDERSKSSRASRHEQSVASISLAGERSQTDHTVEAERASAHGPPSRAFTPSFLHVSRTAHTDVQKYISPVTSTRKDGSVGPRESVGIPPPRNEKSPSSSVRISVIQEDEIAADQMADQMADPGGSGKGGTEDQPTGVSQKWTPSSQDKKQGGKAGLSMRKRFRLIYVKELLRNSGSASALNTNSIALGTSQSKEKHSVDSPGEPPANPTKATILSSTRLDAVTPARGVPKDFSHGDSLLRECSPVRKRSRDAASEDAPLSSSSQHGTPNGTLTVPQQKSASPSSAYNDPKLRPLAPSVVLDRLHPSVSPRRNEGQRRSHATSAGPKGPLVNDVEGPETAEGQNGGSGDSRSSRGVLQSPPSPPPTFPPSPSRSSRIRPNLRRKKMHDGYLNGAAEKRDHVTSSAATVVVTDKDSSSPRRVVPTVLGAAPQREHDDVLVHCSDEDPLPPQRQVGNAERPQSPPVTPRKQLKKGRGTKNTRRKNVKNTARQRLPTPEGRANSPTPAEAPEVVRTRGSPHQQSGSSSPGNHIAPRRSLRKRRPPPPARGYYRPVYTYTKDGPVFEEYRTFGKWEDPRLWLFAAQPKSNKVKTRGERRRRKVADASLPEAVGNGEEEMHNITPNKKMPRKKKNSEESQSELSVRRSHEVKFLPEPGDENNSYGIATQYLLASCHTGLIRIQPGKMKQGADICRNTIIFTAMDNPVHLTTIRNTWVILSKGDSCLVPKGSTYAIRNLSQENQAELHFVVVA